MAIAVLCGRFSPKILLCFVLTAALSIGVYEYLGHRDRIVPVMSNDLDLRKYMPYSADVPRLHEDSTLRIGKDFPVLDGALALYPLYSAYVTALYPKGDYPIGFRNDVRTHRRYHYYDASPERHGEKAIPHPVHFTNTIEGFKGLLNGRVDIFFMADISAEQKEMAAKKDVKLKFTPIGKEAFVFFVNVKNPVDNLSLEQIRGIYSGKIMRWDDLGGRGKIKAFQRNKNSGSQSALERIMGEIPLAEAPTMELRGSMGGIILDVADYKNYENAIGFSFRYFTNVMVQNNQIKLLKIDGVAPTLENIRNGSYPLIAPYYAITRGDAKNPNIPKMLEWFVSERGRYLADKVMGG
ncbi:MAG: substrate-binding domain-containing protein [Candidatus Accumulibacter sp.]|nr:substrate-binding domain-containing protein [Accumulibacter sp.]